MVRKTEVSLEVLKARMQVNESPSFIDAMRHPKNGSLAVIAEIKLASPSAGVLGSEEDILSRIRVYEEGGASALSIITEKHFFKGDPDFIGRARKVTSLPILQKDFLVDLYQLYEAKQTGASAVLLIARILSGEDLALFAREAKTLGLEPVVEVFDENDLAKARVTETNVIAVNARNLDTFEIDVEAACALLLGIPDSYLKLGFSGVEGKAAVAHGILIGTALMKTKDVGSFLKEII